MLSPTVVPSPLTGLHPLLTTWNSDVFLVILVACRYGKILASAKARDGERRLESVSFRSHFSDPIPELSDGLLGHEGTA